MVDAPPNGAQSATTTTTGPAASTLPGVPASGTGEQGDPARSSRRRPSRCRSGCASKGVWLAYGDRWVVRDVSLPVRRGEVLALIGASGSGKTTLLALAESPHGDNRGGGARGTRDARRSGDRRRSRLTRCRRRVSMVFQQPNPFPMSIFENVAYALREEHGEQGARRRRRRSRDDLMPAVVDALRRAGLYEEVAGNLDHPALRLSGGQQQRLCIARALAVDPEVLLLDEPCSALDPISTATIEQLIVGLRESVAIVIVTHNLQQAMRVADHVAFMHLGELVEYGPSEQVFDRPRQQRTREYVSGAFG